MKTLQEKLNEQREHRQATEELLNYLFKKVLNDTCRYKIELGGWLTVEYKAPLNYMPRNSDDYKFYHLFSANIFEITLEQIKDKVIIMLFERLRSIQQDLNGIQDEYILTKK